MTRIKQISGAVNVAVSRKRKAVQDGDDNSEHSSSSSSTSYSNSRSNDEGMNDTHAQKQARLENETTGENDVTSATSDANTPLATVTGVSADGQSAVLSGHLRPNGEEYPRVFERHFQELQELGLPVDVKTRTVPLQELFEREPLPEAQNVDVFLNLGWNTQKKEHTDDIRCKNLEKALHKAGATCTVCTADRNGVDNKCIDGEEVPHCAVYFGGRGAAAKIVNFLVDIVRQKRIKLADAVVVVKGCHFWTQSTNYQDLMYNATFIKEFAFMFLSCFPNGHIILPNHELWNGPYRAIGAGPVELRASYCSTSGRFAKIVHTIAAHVERIKTSEMLESSVMQLEDHSLDLGKQARLTSAEHMDHLDGFFVISFPIMV